MFEARIQKTLEAIRSGTLPLPTSTENMFVQSVNGALCSGCGDLIARLQAYYSVRTRNDSAPVLRLHPGCHDAWRRFTAEPRGDIVITRTPRG
jgi:hypothetical protein